MYIHAVETTNHLLSTPRQPCQPPKPKDKERQKCTRIGMHFRWYKIRTNPLPDGAAAQEKKYLLPLSIVTSKSPFLGIVGNVSGNQSEVWTALGRVGFAAALLDLLISMTK